MLKWRPSGLSALAFLSLLMVASLAQAQAPVSYKIPGVERIKQMTNYCGPATLTSVLRFYGEKVSQDEVGKAIYDASSDATNGADMLLYARDKGYSAYSFNTSIKDVKRIIAQGVPVLVLQQNSTYDTSGHYRVLTGYDDKKSRFIVTDPYYDNITQLTYGECDKLWRTMGYWGLIIVPKNKDTFKAEMNDRNPVVHMDLSYALYKRKSYGEALTEAKTALALEPGNSYTLSMMNKIQKAMNASKRADGEQPTNSPKQVADQKPAEDPKPVEVKAQTDEPKRAEVQKPVEEQKQVEVKKPAEDKKQMDLQKPAEDKKPADAIKADASKQGDGDKQAVSEKPSADVQKQAGWLAKFFMRFIRSLETFMGFAS